MILNGVEPLSPDAVDWFKEQTKRYIEEYYNIFTENDRLQERRSLAELEINKGNGMNDEGDLYLHSHSGPESTKSDDWNAMRANVDDGHDYQQQQHQERRVKELQSMVFDATVVVDVIETDPPYVPAGRVRARARRNLMEADISAGSEGSPVQITYDQQMSYRNNTMDLNDGNGADIQVMDEETIANLIQEPFNTFTRRDKYISYLKDADGPEDVIPIFANLKTVGPPELQEHEKGGKGISKTVIIAASAGGGALLIVAGILFICWRRKRSGLGKDGRMDANVYNATANRPRPSNGVPNGVNSSVLNDDGSTLVDPPAAGGVFNPDGSLKDYGHTPSIGTMDYDYMNANAAASIVSSAGGTLGSRTMQSTKFSGHSQMMGISGMGMSGMIGANGQESSIFDPNDEQSFEQHMYSTRQGQHREEIIEVYAPAGKLGVVIDTPNSGAPVVYNIKDTCPIADKLRVGDKLIAVDNEDVRSMTAPKVSKLISQKSRNRTRKFTVMRPIS